MSIASGWSKNTARPSAWIGRYGRKSPCELARRSTHSGKMPCKGVQRDRPRSHAPMRKINANTGQALARISTDRNSPNNRPSYRVLLDETQGQAVPPGDRRGFFEEIGIQDNGQMGSAVETDSDFPIGNCDIGRHIDEVAKDLACLSIVVAAHLLGHQPI